MGAHDRSKQLANHFHTTPVHSLHNSNTDTNMATSTLPTRGGYDSKAPSVFSVRKIGAPNTLEHRVYIEKDGVPVSAFHDVPLYANEQQTVLNMIVEIPRWSNAKQEVSTTPMPSIDLQPLGLSKRTS